MGTWIVHAGYFLLLFILFTETCKSGVKRAENSILDRAKTV